MREHFTGDINAIANLYNRERAAFYKGSDCEFRELEFMRRFLDGQCGFFFHGSFPPSASFDLRSLT
nr:MAG TPA: hypothetical protein [Caudoviricetes sp.]